jgi:hypothetical protein
MLKFSTQIKVGDKLIVKKCRKEVVVIEVLPTAIVVKFEDGNRKGYEYHEVELCQ